MSSCSPAWCGHGFPNLSIQTSLHPPPLLGFTIEDRSELPNPETLVVNRSCAPCACSQARTLKPGSNDRALPHTVTVIVVPPPAVQTGPRKIPAAAEAAYPQAAADPWPTLLPWARATATPCSAAAI